MLRVKHEADLEALGLTLDPQDKSKAITLAGVNVHLPDIGKIKGKVKDLIPLARAKRQGLKASIKAPKPSGRLRDRPLGMNTGRSYCQSVPNANAWVRAIGEQPAHRDRRSGKGCASPMDQLASCPITIAPRKRLSTQLYLRTRRKLQGSASRKLDVFAHTADFLNRLRKFTKPPARTAITLAMTKADGSGTAVPTK